MKSNFKRIGILGVVVVAATGCSSIGNAPAGADFDQLKAKQAEQPPLQQIRNLRYSPMPPAQKEEQIKAIEQKYHVSRDDAMKNLPEVHFGTTPPPAVPGGKNGG